MAKQHVRRCLIVERHAWETGGRQQQLQFVLQDARQFFGPGTIDRTITIRFRLSPTTPNRQITISREYANGTRRTNNFPEMQLIPAGFIFFQETDTPGTYDFWWQANDTVIVAARYQGWRQGRNSQFGRGRLSVIVPAPVPLYIDRID